MRWFVSLNISVNHIRNGRPIESRILSCTIFKLFDLEIWVRGHSRFENFDTVFFSPSIVTQSCIISEISKILVDFSTPLHSTSLLGGADVCAKSILV